MQSIGGFPAYELSFDSDGNPDVANEFPVLRKAAPVATDAILLAHDFGTDIRDATTLYSDFLDNFRSHLARPEFQEIAERQYVVGCIYWPSHSVEAAKGTRQAALRKSVAQKIETLKELAPGNAEALDEAAALIPRIKSDSAAQDKFTSLVFSTLEGAQLDPAEGLHLIRRHKGSEILATLASASNTLAGVDLFLDLAIFHAAQNRACMIGSVSIAQAVRDLRAANHSIKVHLIGHGFGARLMATCATSLAQPPLLQPDSLTLLDAAISQYAFSANYGSGDRGVFRDIITKQVVRGPLVATFSAEDTVCNLSSAITARLLHAAKPGSSKDSFGSIGAHGCRNTSESFVQSLRPAGSLSAPYSFRTGVVNCLDGSGGLIKNHDDVANPDVTYAFASAVASTLAGHRLMLGASV